MAASVQQRLLNLAKARGADFQHLLTQYAIERFLYRLSQSPHAHCFILKGALLFLLWMEEPPRRTKDLDLLGAGDPSPARLTEICRELCALAVENDGLTFAPETVSARFIREDNVYGSVRIRLVAFLWDFPESSGNTRRNRRNGTPSCSRAGPRRTRPCLWRRSSLS
jgi:hypothetical protein